MITEAFRVGAFGIDDRVNAFLLIAFYNSGLHAGVIARRDKDRRRDKRDHDISHPDSRQKKNGREDRKIRDRLTRIRFKHDESDRACQDRTPYKYLLKAERSAFSSAEILCQHENGRDLNEFRRLELADDR